MKLKFSDTLWAGTEASLHDYLEAVAGVEAFHQSGAREQDSGPRLLDVQGNVGVISIKGPLANKDAWYNALIGVTSYSEIRDALVQSAKDPDIEHILLDIDSGGGSVAGVADTGNLIRAISDNIKPVTAFTDGTMASAAYWLGSSAGKVYATQTAMVGSIGVIATHMEKSRALEDAGISVTVMRAGKYKALVNSVERLTDDAKAQMQTHLDAAYRIFVDHVAEARGVSYEIADSTMAQGREFMGAAAQTAGLVDGISSYDAVFSDASKKLIDTSVNLIDNSKKNHKQEVGMGKRALSDVEIAAAAAGVLGDIEGTDEAVDAAAGTPDANADADAGSLSGTGSDTPDADAQGGVVDFLKVSLKEKEDALINAKLEVKDLSKQLDDLRAAQDGLLQIAGNSISNMQVALGGGKFDVAGLTAAQVVAEHTRTANLFTNKFKVGGVAAVDAPQQTQAKAPVSAAEQATLNAVRFS